MKIVHIITRLIVGGAQENTLLSCEGQHDRGHEVTLITGPALGPEGSLLDRARAYGYRVELTDEMRRAVLPMKDLGSFRQLVSLLRQIRPDIVHTHSSKAGILGRWAAWRAGVPVIIHTIHGLAFTASMRVWVNGLYKMAERATACITDRIVCVADAMREQSLGAGIGRRDQYVTVYSGMNAEPFFNPPVHRQEVRRRLGLEDHHVVVGTIARLFYLKGHEDLLEAAPRLCREMPNLRFLWVGNGLLRPDFEEKMQKMGLRDRFVMAGLVRPQHIPELVAAMDIVAHPSRREGLARAIVQGQLAGLPVVAYDVDGNREGLLDGQSGYAVKAFATGQFIERCRQLAGNPDLRRRMGAAGRDFARQRFAASTMVEGLERLYADCVLRSKRD